MVERFRREARAASRIGQANIVDVTDSGTTDDGAFYFVMEFLDGVNLEELIADVGPLPVTRALLITAQIARALEAAHAADIIHRDLKPANVMLVTRKDEDDFVKVLDFGISKDLDAAAEQGGGLTRPNVAIGTPVYMSPEQAAGRPAGPLSDVYAVGGLLYEMLTGQPPCGGDDAMAVLARKATHDPAPARTLRPDLSPGIDRLLARALARNPAERYPSMTALKDDLLANLTAFEEADAPMFVPPVMRDAARGRALQTTRLRLLVPRFRIVAVGGVLGPGGGVRGLASFGDGTTRRHRCDQTFRSFAHHRPPSDFGAAPGPAAAEPAVESPEEEATPRREPARLRELPVGLGPSGARPAAVRSARPPRSRRRPACG